MVLQFKKLLSIFCCFFAVPAFANPCIDGFQIHIQHINNKTIANFDNCNLGYNELDAIINKIWNQHLQINELSLAHNKIDDASIHELYIAESTFPFLAASARVDLSDNKIGWKGAADLSAISSIGELSLAHNALGDVGASTFRNTSDSLIILNLSDNHIGDKGFEELAHNITIQKLSLESNHISTVQSFALDNKTVTDLDLNNNQLGNHNFSLLLYYAENLRILNVANNDITDYVFDFFPNTRVEVLNLDQNSISTHLLTLVIKFPYLVKLSLKNSNINSASTMLLASNQSISELDLSDNHIFDSGAIALSQKTLHILNVMNNKSVC